MKQKYLKYFLLPLIIFSFISGCREDIIPPDNPVTNINEPVQQKAFNSYTFSINADDISFNLVEYPNLHSSYNRLSLYVDDYSSGSADISIININDATIYFSRLDRDVQGTFIDITDNIPAIIKISCKSFSGKLKVQLSAF